ncbi:MAG: Abi family protein [Ruminiclostridium sp.]|nr:Abi family protein [Ruminiclostridium sp.]
MPKPFLTYEQQLNKLTQERNLIIQSPSDAEEYLKRIGYYALICGYKDIFKNPTTKKYKDGVTFEEIVALYRFDEALRELFLKYLIRIERHLRSSISYYFTDLHSESQSEYLNPTNYNNIARYSAGINKLILMLDELANTSTQHAHIVYNRNSYNNVPLWVIMTGITFGSLSKMYMYLPSNIRTKVSQDLKANNQKELQQYLSVLTSFRNFCAHGERLFSRTVNENIPDTELHRKLGIPKIGANYKYGKGDLFSVVIAFRYLIPSEDFLKFKAALINLIKHFLKNTTHVTEQELLKMMGFPKNWKDITRYKK